MLILEVKFFQYFKKEVSDLDEGLQDADLSQNRYQIKFNELESFRVTLARKRGTVQNDSEEPCC